MALFVYQRGSDVVRAVSRLDDRGITVHSLVVIVLTQVCNIVSYVILFVSHIFLPFYDRIVFCLHYRIMFGE